MARISFGADIFSPVRSDMSLNDSIFRNNSSRSSISEDSRKTSESENSCNLPGSVERRRKKDLLPHEGGARHDKNKKVESRAKKNEAESNTLLLVAPCVKVQDDDVSPRRSKRLQKNTVENIKKETGSKDGSSQHLNKNVSLKHANKKSNNLMSSKFITVRGRGSMSNEKVESCTENVLETNLTAQSVKLEEKGNSVLEANPTAQYVKLEEKENCLDFLKSKINGSRMNKINEENEVVESDNLLLSNQTTILLSPQNEEINIADSKTSSSIKECNLEQTRPINNSLFSNQTIMLSPAKEKIEVEDSETSSSIHGCNLEKTRQMVVSKDAAPNEPTQIQANIIEKLVENAVSSECDMIRQLQYSHQIGLLRALNETREEADNRYARNTEKLYNIIEELLEENRQLRAAILARK